MAASKRKARHHTPSGSEHDAKREQPMPTVSHADAAQARGASHARKPAATAAQPAEEKSPETRQGEQKPSRKRRALASVGSWTAAVAAAGVGGVLTVVILELSSSHAAPARPASAADPPITALIDLSGSGPCGSPQTVVASPGPIGRSASGDYPGLPAPGGWLNVLVQGDGGEPVTIESITAKVISRQPEKRGTVLYSYCQGYSPSHTYIRLDLRQSQPAAVNVPEPNPPGPQPSSLCLSRSPAIARRSSTSSRSAAARPCAGPCRSTGNAAASQGP